MRAGLRLIEEHEAKLHALREHIAGSIERGGAHSDDDIALQYVGKLREQCRKLAELPGQLGRARPELGDNIRSFPHGNYVIFFIYNADDLDIVTIIEGHRDIDSLFEIE